MTRDVRYWHKADMGLCAANVRYCPKADIAAFLALGRTAGHLAAITALGLTLLPGNALSAQKSLKEQLVGTWKIVAVNNTVLTEA
jgi:hypothetical protein